MDKYNLTPRMHKILADARIKARGDALYTGEAHVLAAMIRENGAGGQILAELGLTIQKLQELSGFQSL